MAKKKSTTQSQSWAEIVRAMEEEAEAEYWEHIKRFSAGAGSFSKSSSQEAYLKAQWEIEKQER